MILSINLSFTLMGLALFPHMIGYPWIPLANQMLGLLSPSCGESLVFLRHFLCGTKFAFLLNLCASEDSSDINMCATDRHMMYFVFIRCHPNTQSECWTEIFTRVQTTMLFPFTKVKFGELSNQFSKLFTHQLKWGSGLIKHVYRVSIKFVPLISAAITLDRIIVFYSKSLKYFYDYIIPLYQKFNIRRAPPCFFKHFIAVVTWRGINLVAWKAGYCSRHV